MGGLVAKPRDSRFNDDRLRKLGDSLTPGTLAIVVVTQGDGFDEEVEKYLAKAAATILTEPIRTDGVDQLKSGRDIAGTTVVHAGAVETGRVDSEMASSAGTDSGPAVAAAAGSEETGAPAA